MRKALKITGIVFAAVLFLPAAAFALWEGFCAAANGISAHRQTESVLNGLSNSAAIEVLDKATFVGNTTGTGNHTEARTTVLVRACSMTEVEYWTYGDEYSVTPLYDVPENRTERMSRWRRELDLPADASECYVVEVIGSVPFPDSIAGH